MRQQNILNAIASMFPTKVAYLETQHIVEAERNRVEGSLSPAPVVFADHSAFEAEHSPVPATLQQHSHLHRGHCLSARRR